MGDDELLQQVGTIPQALLRMNGRFSSELSKAELLTAAGQILDFSPNDQAVVENSYLTCLARRPSDEEKEYFVAMLDKTYEAAAKKREASPGTPEMDPKPDRSRAEVVQDIFWTLYNSPEFSWNH